MSGLHYIPFIFSLVFAGIVAWFFYREFSRRPCPILSALFPGLHRFLLYCFARLIVALENAAL